MKATIKKTLLLFAVVLFASCSLQDDNYQPYSYEVLPVESFTVPESFVMGQTYTISVTYKRPSDCHFFEGFYYEKEGNVRTIAVQTSVLQNNNCSPLTDNLVDASFNFIVTPGNTSYIFKFYKGTDEANQDLFEQVEVPVTY